MTTLDDFLGGESPQAGAPPPSPPPEEAPVPEPTGVSQVLTPAGIEVYYQEAPKRLYRVRQPDIKIRTEGGELESIYREWREVPSVTTVIDVLDRSGALTYWGMKVGAQGVAALARKGLVVTGQADPFGGRPLMIPNGAGGLTEITMDNIAPLLGEHKLTVNDVKESGGRRGQNAHDALETWIEKGILPQIEVFPEEEQGYVTGLRSFLEAIDGKVEDLESEVMVGSVEHGFAGRYDMRFRLAAPALVCRRAYPKKKDVYGELEPGRYLPDLKTSKYVMSKQFLQLAAYEGASIEDGYEPSDFHAVIHVMPDGRYEVRLSTDKQFVDPRRGEIGLEDFLAVKQAYHVTTRKGWR
jgi:hypothetical protein